MCVMAYCVAALLYFLLKAKWLLWVPKENGDVIRHPNWCLLREASRLLLLTLRGNDLNKPLTLRFKLHSGWALKNGPLATQSGQTTVWLKSGSVWFLLKQHSYVLFTILWWMQLQPFKCFNTISLVFQSYTPFLLLWKCFLSLSILWKSIGHNNFENFKNKSK